MDSFEFAARVRQRKNELQLSQTELADHAGVSASQVAKLLGRHPPRPERRTVIKLARALEWDPDVVLQWLGYELLTAGEHSTVHEPLSPAADRLKTMLRLWCRLPKPDQDVVMEVMTMLDSRRPARSGTGVTLFEAGAVVSSADPQSCGRERN